MTEILTKAMYDIETQTYKEIPLSEEELTQREIDNAAAAARQTAQAEAQEALEAARASAVSKLIAVGLTEEEIAALKG